MTMSHTLVRRSAPGLLLAALAAAPALAQGLITTQRLSAAVALEAVGEAVARRAPRTATR
jgi:hypothetical protein